MLADVGRDVGARRKNLEILSARIIERGASQLCGDSPSAERSRNLRVVVDDATGLAAIGEKRQVVVENDLKPGMPFVVKDSERIYIDFRQRFNLSRSSKVLTFALRRAKQLREFRMIHHDLGIVLNGVIVFLLEDVTRIARCKHFASEIEGDARVAGSDGTFSG